MSSTHCLYYKKCKQTLQKKKSMPNGLRRSDKHLDTEHYLWYRGILHMIVEMFIISYAEDTVS